MNTPGSNVPHDVSVTLTEPEVTVISEILLHIEDGDPVRFGVMDEPAFKSALTVIENARYQAWGREAPLPQAQIDDLRREERDRRRIAGDSPEPPE